ncbi:MAG TPA: hypothetical protein RMG48_08550 [Myxococcales bacterium LLY-WYZ-16_1]|nr:hypothetical protein [Myxococcales bacterium LLY-WYZ-16_1]
MTEIGKPFKVPGTPGHDHFYTTTMPSQAGPRAVVLDVDREEVVFNEALEDAQARGVVFPGSPGNDVYEIGAGGFPVSVVDFQGRNNHAENSDGDRVSGAVVGTANNIGTDEGIQGRVVGSGVSDAELESMQRQVLGQLSGAGPALDRFRAEGRQATRSLEDAGGTKPSLEQVLQNSVNSW